MNQLNGSNQRRLFIFEAKGKSRRKKSFPYGGRKDKLKAIKRFLGANSKNTPHQILYDYNRLFREKFIFTLKDVVQPPKPKPSEVKSEKRK